MKSWSMSMICLAVSHFKIKPINALVKSSCNSVVRTPTSYCGDPVLIDDTVDVGDGGEDDFNADDFANSAK